jgi:transglutaminase-like putative cysteine protease
MTTVRRAFLKNGAAAAMAVALPSLNFAQSAPAPSRGHFAPQSGAWRTFDVTTRVDIVKPQGVTKVWLPIPSVNSDYQHSLGNSFSSNGSTLLTQDGRDGARMLYAEFPATETQPFVELTSRVQTQGRAIDWSQKTAAAESADTLRYFTRPTVLIPTDGIVRKTALAATQGAKTDVEKAQKLYDWIVANTYREPKVRGCGEGDIKTMLETGNLGGKCADLNALFVGLCRSVGVPARDVYGIRLVPSAFGYKELSGNPGSLKGAQHCRSEVYLKGYGWVAMDPADVAKVMRLETPTGSRPPPIRWSRPSTRRCSAAGKATGWPTTPRTTWPCRNRPARSWASSCTPSPKTRRGALIPTRRTTSSTRSRRKKSSEVE